MALTTTLRVVPAPPAADGPPPAVRARLEIALLLLVCAWFFVPRLLQTLAISKTHIAVGAPAPAYTPLASLSQRGLFYLTVALCLFIIVLLWRHSPTRGMLALFIYLLPWGYLVVRDQYAGQQPQNVYKLLPVLAVAVWLLRPRLARLELLGYVVVFTAVTSMVIGAVIPDHGVLRNSAGQVVSVDKQLLPWGSLVGIFSNGNNLGQFLAMGLPAVLLIRSRGMRVLGVLCCLFALVWSASRGSMYAVGLASVAYLVVSRARREARAALTATILGAAFLLVCVLPFVTTDPTAFTNRGAVWAASRLAWGESPLVGKGSNWFSILGSSSASIGSSVFHAHNQFLHLLVTGGVLLAVLAAAMVITMIIAAARLAAAGHWFGVGYVAALAGTCLLEVSLVFVDGDLLFPVAVLPILFILFTADLDAAGRGRGAP
ncbi:MAG: O-antigen ligase family protein [Jatrophihabitans sp.]|uniref:O-antigen ligase family protein n=1 Tax=Jatrophihabitans sp. TaxID=1932789 RepID=UPI003F80E464